MSTGLHKDLEIGEIHRSQSLEYANASARTGATGLTSDDVGRIAHQTDDDSFWILTDDSPVTWAAVDSSSMLTSTAPADVTKSAAQVGTGTQAARDDHKHDISTAAPPTVGTANSEGAATSLARSDHVHDHGAQTTATHHAVATTGANGFISSADKTKLDGVATGATNTPLTSTAPVDVTKAAAAVGSSSEAARQDHKHDVTTAAAGAATPGDAAQEGAATSLARSDHQHSLPAFGTGSGTFCEGDDSRLSDDRTADGLRTATTVVAISGAAAPTSGQVLKATSGTAATWQDETGGGGGSVQEKSTLYPDMLQQPSGSDWSVNVSAAIAEDPTNAAVIVGRFDDTTEEALGVPLTAPTGATLLTLKFKSRAITAPGSAETVALTLHYREIPDNGAVGTWSEYDFTDIDVPTNANFQYDEQSVFFTTLSITAGRLYQFQISRNAGDAGDTLSGDWALAEFTVEFDVDSLDRVLFYGDQLDYPTSSDWDIDDPAAGSIDSNNASLIVRRFDDTTQEAVGFSLATPSGATSLTIKEKSRAETAPGSAETVARTLHYREIPDNGAVGTWSSLDLMDISIPTNENFQYDMEVITFVTLGVVAGRLYQWELSRDTGDAGDTLSGDWTLAEVTMEFS